MTNWTTWWSRSQRGLGLIVKNGSKHHRLVLKEIPKSSKLRLKFAAYYDIQPIKIENGYCYDGDFKKEITFDNHKTLLLHPEADCFSDEIEIKSQTLIIEYDVVTVEGYSCVSGFESMDYDIFVEAPQQIYALQSIELLSDELKGCLCIFGDSIVEQGNYTREIKNHIKQLGYSLINLGISGNRLLNKIESVDFSKTDNIEVTKLLNQQIYQNISIDKQCFGISGIDRYKKEVLSCQNISAVIIAIGVNDLYQPGTFCSQIDELPSLEKMKNGYQKLEQLTQGIPVFWANITPFTGNLHATKEKEQLRLDLNKWLNEYFNNSIVFDHLLIDQNNKLITNMYQDDCLHPNRDGGKIMAKEIIKCLNILF